MPYTTPTPYWETTGTPASTYLAAKELATFINGRHPTQTNAVPWAIVDCYDGTTREQPTDGDSDNLSAGNLWREDQGTPPQNSWIVWQAPGGGDITARYQIYMEISSFGSVFFGVFMLNDWVVNGGTPLNPDIPATALGVPAFFNGVSCTFSNHNTYVWWCSIDEGGIYVVAHPTVGGSTEHFVVGDLVPDNNQTLNPRPFVISENTSWDGWNTNFRYVSVLDDTTICQARDEPALAAAFADADDEDVGFTARPICDVACWSATASNRFRIGKFRLVAAISRHALLNNTERVTCGVGPTDYDYQISGDISSAALVVSRYGGGVALDRHQKIVEASIPETLEPS